MRYESGVRRVGVLLFFAACSPPAVPAMHPPLQPGDPIAPPPHTIVFVRPPSPCDTSDHARVVDADGRFLGALGSGTWFAAPRPPGEQVYYVWPGLDLRLEMQPELQPVDVIHVTAGEGKTTYVGVRVFEHEKLECGKYAVFRFTRPHADDAERWRKDGRELVTDHAEGDALLARDADVTRAYMEMAKAKQERFERE